MFALTLTGMFMNKPRNDVRSYIVLLSYEKKSLTNRFFLSDSLLKVIPNHSPGLNTGIA